jgi:pyrimidine-specific ribonucleoside hydrolase
MNHKSCLRWLLVLVFIVLLTPVFSVTTQSGVFAQPETTSVIIDTDMAVDDWMAILYLLQRTDVDVLAVTVAGTGEAHCDPGVRNALNLLMLAGNPDIPVACGRETPLQGENTFPLEWRDMVDAMNGLQLPENPNTADTGNAVDLLRQTLQAAERPVRLVALGPLTNIAELLDAEPDLVGQIEMLVVMGGAVDVPGNLQGGMRTDNAAAEWNIYVDPQAAALVIASGVPITLIPLDATNHAPLTLDFFTAVSGDRATPEAEFLYQILYKQIGFVGSGYWFFWDPLAAVAATDERVVTIEDRTLSVITADGDELGRTLSDENGYPVRVAVDADVSLLEQLLLDVLNGRDSAQTTD